MLTEYISTPLLPIANNILIKLECNNPGGSHKTRAARYIVKEAIKQGAIIPGKTTVIEKTGGNFGFGLAIACQEHNISVELVVGLGYSQLKRRCLTFSGAKLVGQDMLKEGIDPRIIVESYIDEYRKTGKSCFYPDQFYNKLCIEAHEKGTGAELVQQLRTLPDLKKIIFVACAGTGASITGIYRALVYQGYTVETVMVEPQGCDSSNGTFASHKMEGMSVGIAPPLIDWDIISSKEYVTYEEMTETKNWFFQSSGYFIGNTSAACLSVTRTIASKINSSNIKVLSIIYDLGHWYVTD